MTSIYESFSIQNVSTKGPLNLKSIPVYMHGAIKPVYDKLLSLHYVLTDWIQSQ